MNFPNRTVFNKKIPKKQFYDHLSISSATKNLFTEQISAIYWQNKLSADLINLSEGTKVSEIEIFRIVLNQNKIDESFLKLIDKGIPYHIIFILEYSKQIKLCGAYKEVGASGVCNFVSKHYYTEWSSEENTILTIKGLTLDNVYEGFIRQIAGSELQKITENIKDDITQSEARQKLEKEIARLEKKARAEKQPKKKFELVSQLKQLKQKIEYLSSANNDKSVKSKPKIKEFLTDNVSNPETQVKKSVKALSIMPEFAALIFDGLKTVEWRSWKTDYRGDLLICTSSRKLKGCISGYALCMVELVDVVPFTRKHLNGAMMDSVPNPAGYAWLLKNARLIKPFPYKGKLHLYDVDASLVEALSPIGTKEADEEFEKYYKQLYIEAGAKF